MPKCPESTFKAGDCVNHPAHLDSPPLFAAGCGCIVAVLPCNTADGYSYLLKCDATGLILPVTFDDCELTRNEAKITHGAVHSAVAKLSPTDWMTIFDAALQYGGAAFKTVMAVVAQGGFGNASTSDIVTWIVAAIGAVAQNQPMPPIPGAPVPS
jgi:hypothetical protein